MCSQQKKSSPSARFYALGEKSFGRNLSLYLLVVKNKRKKLAALRNSDKWQVARAYWVYERLTQEEICEKLDIHPKTLISWRKQGGWDELRNYESNLVNKRLLLFTKLFELFENEISKESPNIDELLKIQTLIDKNTVKATSNAEMVQEVGLLWIRYLGENITEDGLKQVLLENYRDFAKWYINHIK